MAQLVEHHLAKVGVAGSNRCPLHSIALADRVYSLAIGLLARVAKKDTRDSAEHSGLSVGTPRSPRPLAQTEVATDSAADQTRHGDVAKW